MRKSRPRLHRPAGVGDPRDGLQERSQDPHGKSRSAIGPRLPRRQAGACVPAKRSRQDRLPGPYQSFGRRRRQGHARCRKERRLRGRPCFVPTRIQGLVRRRPCADRKIPHPPAAHRDPGVRGQPGKLRALLRARLLGATPPPESARGGPGAGDARGAPQSDGRGRRSRRQGRRLRGRRHSGVHREHG